MNVKKSGHEGCTSNSKRVVLRGKGQRMQHPVPNARGINANVCLSLDVSYCVSHVTKNIPCVPVVCGVNIGPTCGPCC